MEPWQAEIIRANKYRLVKLINPDVGLLAKLESCGLLFSRDLELLKLPNKTRGDKVDELLECLINREASYDKLRVALEDTLQSAAAEILVQGKIHHDAQAKKPLTPGKPENAVEAAYKWEQLSDEQKLSLLTHEIRLSGYVFWEQSFYQYLEKATTFRKFVSENVEQLIDKAYSGELHTAENLLRVIYNSCSDTSKLKGFEKLHFKIHEKNRTWSVDNLTLLYYIGLVLRNDQEDNTPYKNLEEPPYKKYKKLRSKFPEALLAIISNQHVVIKHQHYKEYLFESQHVETDLRRTLFCWKPKNAVGNGYFKFEAKMQDEQLFFILRNDAKDRGAAVCQAPSSWKYLKFIPSSKRWMVNTSPQDPDLSNGNGTTKVLEDFKWIVEPVGNKSFKLKTWNGKYLYAPNIFYSHDHERRYVFLWKGWHDDLTDKETTWTIETKAEVDALPEEKRKPKFILRERSCYEIQRHWWVILFLILLVLCLFGKTVWKSWITINQLVAKKP